jgi:molybdenum cofactor guanylyltransferase
VAEYAAVILAGGAGRRLGGAGKPLIEVGGRPMLARVLDAVAGAAQRIVVGPDSLPLPPGVCRVREEPPGGGPVAATAAGLALVGAPTVALLAADLPFLDAGAVAELRAALADQPAGDTGGRPVDGVVFVDPDGRRQTLCGVWRTVAVRAAVDRLGPPAGVPVRALLAGLRVAELPATADPPPWYDCDRPDDLLRAEGWT